MKHRAFGCPYCHMMFRGQFIGLVKTVKTRSQPMGKFGDRLRAVKKNWVLGRNPDIPPAIMRATEQAWGSKWMDKHFPKTWRRVNEK